MTPAPEILLGKSLILPPSPFLLLDTKKSAAPRSWGWPIWKLAHCLYHLTVFSQVNFNLFHSLITPNGARPGIEPGTHGFSVRFSLLNMSWLILLKNKLSSSRFVRENKGKGVWFPSPSRGDRGAQSRHPVLVGRVSSLTLALSANHYLMKSAKPQRHTPWMINRAALLEAAWTLSKNVTLCVWLPPSSQRKKKGHRAYLNNGVYRNGKVSHKYLACYFYCAYMLRAWAVKLPCRGVNTKPVKKMHDEGNFDSHIYDMVFSDRPKY